MTSKDKAPSKPGFKEKAIEEFRDFVAIALYLGFFFCALSLYGTLLLKKHDISYLNYSFAIINALVIAKVILIGEMLHLGRRMETKPLFLSVLYKSILFGILVFAFHLLEEMIKRVIHHEPRGTVLHNFDLNDLIARSIVIFCAFVPLFAFRELGRVLGEEKVHALFFKHHDAARATTLSPTRS